jgi:hypothetical protein
MMLNECDDPFSIAANWARPQAAGQHAHPEPVALRAPPVDVSDLSDPGDRERLEAQREADVERSELRELPPPSGIRSGFVSSPATMPIARLGLPWKPDGMRPTDGVSLSRWQPTDGGEVVRSGEPPAEGREGAAAVRLCVACLLRAAPLAAVDGFLRYYHAIGFERVVLFFVSAPRVEPALLPLPRA